MEEVDYKIMSSKSFLHHIYKYSAYLIIVFAVLTSGCKKPKPPDNVMVLALRSDPMYLNPVLASENSSMDVNAFIFNCLVKYDERMKLKGDLAESWEISENGTIMTFHLRKDIAWHDGAPFKAEDIKFTFDTLFDSKTNTFNRGLFQIDGIKPEIIIVNDNTVQFRLQKAFAPFLTNLTQMGIIPSHLLKGKDINRCEFNWHPVGTGPFRFKEWKSSERVYLEANKTYFKGSPQLKGILLLIIPSAESRRIALLTGTIDISSLATEDLRILPYVKNVNIFRWSQFVYYYIGFDLTKELFKDRAVRQAINYAINKEKIIKAVLKGAGRVATGPIPLPSWAYSNKVEKYEYNPQKARTLLKRAGWTETNDGMLIKNGKKLEFELRYPSGNPQCEKASVFIQGYLNEAGIKMALRATEFSALINTCNPGQFEAIMLDWVENIDPDCFIEWHSSMIGDKGMNFMSYSNPEIDRILMEARTVIDIEKRKALYQKFQKVLVDDAPYVFLWDPDAVVAINKRIKGLPVPGPAGLFIAPEKISLKSTE